MAILLDTIFQLGLFFYSMFCVRRIRTRGLRWLRSRVRYSSNYIAMIHHNLL